MDNYQQVLLQMAQFGIELQEKNLPLRTDTPKRVTCGKGGKDWYRLYVFRPDAGGAYVVGTFGTYRHGGSWAKVEVDWKPLSDAERSRMAAERAAQRAKAQAERAAIAAHAAMGAAELLSSAKREGASPYLERKQVVGEACRYLPDGTIVVPLMRYDLPVDQRLQAVQRILPSGQKFFTKGFGKPGCCVRLGTIDANLSPLLLVTEGYATGLTARMATVQQRPVFVALDAGNLAHVVPLLRELYPRTRILILADDDWLTRDQHTGELVNPGRSAAKGVAKQVPGCDFLSPIFDSALREAGDTDFNDLHVRQGLGAVQGQLAGVVAAMARFYG